MTDSETLMKLYKLNEKIESRKATIKKLNKEIEEDKNELDGIFSRKFKIRGIHARVEEYSARENEIILAPAPPDSGIDRLHLTFEEFADQVEFLDLNLEALVYCKNCDNQWIVETKEIQPNLIPCKKCGNLVSLA